MTPPVVSIRGISVTFRRENGTTRALEDVSLDINEGEVLAIIGESGSGKTTLGLMMQGLLASDSQPVVTGSLKILGHELVNANRKLLRTVRRDFVRAIPQEPIAALDPTMRIRKQLRGSNYHGDHVADEWLSRIGLKSADAIPDKFPHELSGGQRQRVLIAMAAMALPKVLVADEPTTALDIAAQMQVVPLFRDLADRHGTAVAFITHNLKVAAEVADRILVLREGVVVETHASPQSISNQSHVLASRLGHASRHSPVVITSEGNNPAPPSTGHPAAPRVPRNTGPGSEEDHAPKVSVPEGSPNRRVSRSTLSINRDKSALRLNNISHTFRPRASIFHERPTKTILSSVNLSVAVGECIALTGESGVGKTTLLRIAAGLTKPDTGSVETASTVRPQVVFQDAVASFTPWLTIGEQIGDRLRLLHLTKRQKADKIAEALENVSLSPHLMTALPGKLSVGQCQRAAIARALVVPPSILLCDEPTSAMDQGLARATLYLLDDIRLKFEVALLFISHDVESAALIADRIVLLDRAKLTEINPLSSLDTARFPMRLGVDNRVEDL